MNSTAEWTFEKSFILFFRLAVGWTFLYAGGSQLLEHFSAAGFLNATKTFHPLFAWFATPGMLPYTDFLVSWGHLLIGLSPVSGLMVRVSAPFGIMLLTTYYFGHMNFPYISDETNMFIDYHLIYDGVLLYLIVKRAGHVVGLDGWVENLPIFVDHPGLKPLID